MECFGLMEIEAKSHDSIINLSIAIRSVKREGSGSGWIRKEGKKEGREGWKGIKTKTVRGRCN